jgi:hypothetical protein
MSQTKIPFLELYSEALGKYRKALGLKEKANFSQRHGEFQTLMKDAADIIRSMIMKCVDVEDICILMTTMGLRYNKEKFIKHTQHMDTWINYIAEYLKHLLEEQIFPVSDYKVLEEVQA